MSRRELQRVEVMAWVASDELTLVDAGKMLGRSYRQVKRLWRRYREEGPEGLKHRSAGSRRRTLGSWCSWTEVSTAGSNSGGRKAV